MFLGGIVLPQFERQSFTINHRCIFLHCSGRNFPSDSLIKKVSFHFLPVHIKFLPILAISLVKNRSHQKKVLSFFSYRLNVKNFSFVSQSRRLSLTTNQLKKHMSIINKGCNFDSGRGCFLLGCKFPLNMDQGKDSSHPDPMLKSITAKPVI